MIRRFACKETERLFNDEPSRRLPAQIQRAARRKLLLLHQARRLQDLRVPYGNHLEALQDDRIGQHSIRVNDQPREVDRSPNQPSAGVTSRGQWRICFRWQGEDALDVEIVDDH
jgi:proteic killer suppression protein